MTVGAATDSKGISLWLSHKHGTFHSFCVQQMWRCHTAAFKCRNGTTMSEKRKILPSWLLLFQLPNTLPKCSSLAIFSSLSWFSFLSLPYSCFQLLPVPKCLSRHFLPSPHPPPHLPSSPLSLQSFRKSFLELGESILIWCCLNRTRTYDMLAKSYQVPV